MSSFYLAVEAEVGGFYIISIFVTLINTDVIILDKHCVKLKTSLKKSKIY